MAQRWPRYTWNAKARQYVDERGRFVARSSVKAALSDVIDSTAMDMRTTSERLQRGEIEIADWQLEMEHAIKTIHTAATAIACGGWIQAMPADWAECGRRLRAEYAYLRDFAIELENGLPLDGRFLARAAQYGRAAHGTYEVTARRLALAGGAMWARRTRHTTESCEACIGYEERGWVPAATLPAPGTECECGSNCLCTMDFSWSVDHPESNGMRKPPGARVSQRGRAWAWVASQAWAIEPQWLKTIATIAERTNLDPETVAAQLGRELDNTHAVTVRDGVATIPVRGPISKYANLLSEISDATSIEALATDLHAAVDDPAIRAIILHIDSPGGTANGVGEFAGQVREASDRKPVVAYVGDNACSAALLIASACSEVVIAEWGIMGSMGVVVRIPMDDDEEEEIISSQSPNKRPDPSTKAGRAELQRHVDEMADIFIRQVAAYRDLDPATIAERFGHGGTKIGAKAVEAGMADRVGTYEGVVAELQQAKQDSRGGRAVSFLPDRSAAASAQGPKTMKLSMRSILSRWNAAGRPEEIDVEASEGGDDIDTFLKNLGAEPPKPPAAKPAPDLKTIERKAQREALVMAFGPQAKSFAEGLVKAGKITPAKAQGVAGLYLDAAVRDALQPLTVDGQPISRLDTFKETFEARPAAHAHHTQEFVPQEATAVAAALKAGGLKLFDNGASSPVEAERAKSLSRVEQMLAGSELGQQVLREAK